MFHDRAILRWSVVCGLLVGLLPCGAQSVEGAYVIQLKNGNEYVTNRYWQEGGQLLFDTYNGVFGIERSFVAKIEKTDDALRLQRLTEGGSNENTQAQTQTQSKESAEAKAKGELKTEKKREPDDLIVNEFNRLKDKSSEVDGLLTTEIRDLLNQITVFKNKIAKDSKLFIDYSREFNDLHGIGTTVENALRSRTQ